MAELELRYKMIEECIGSMEKLPMDYPAETPPFISGKGAAIAEIEKLVNLYAACYESLEILSKETAEYLSLVAAGFWKADKGHPLKQMPCNGQNLLQNPINHAFLQG